MDAGSTPASTSRLARRPWSAALRDHPVAPDGIAYSARHDPHETCYALFDHTEAAPVEEGRATDLDADWFWRLADVYDVGSAPS